MKAIVPKMVADALDYHMNLWTNMSNDSINLTLMAIPFSTVHGQALILKEFAKNHPTLYLQALVNGYEPSTNIQEELSEMINKWLNKPYVGNEKRDVEDFARMVTTYFQQHL